MNRAELDPSGACRTIESFSAITAAIGAASQARAEYIGAVLDRDGVGVSLATSGVIEITRHSAAEDLDAVVLEAGIDGIATSDGVRRVRGAIAHAAIVVVCAPSLSPYVARYLEAGADGVAFTDDLAVTLAAVVRSATAGQISIPGNMRHLLAPPALSHREKQALELAVRGLTNRQIADRLFLAESTVKTHLSSAFRRLGVSSRREAAALFSSTADEFSLRRTRPTRRPVAAVPAVPAGPMGWPRDPGCER
jgi:DNA-binding NarL/FixJ family response regulator